MVATWLAGSAAAIGFVAVAHSTGPEPPPRVAAEVAPELRCDRLGEGYDEDVEPSWEAALQRTHEGLRYGSDPDTVPALERLVDEAADRDWPCAEGRAQMLLGAAHATLGAPAKAAESFGAAALLGESLDFDLMVVRGWSRAVDQSLRAGELDEAREQLRHASAYGQRRAWAPELAAAIEVTRADVASAEGRYEDAVASLERALEGGLEGTDRGHAHDSLASALVRLNRVDEAVLHAETALREFDAAAPGAHDRLEVLDLLTRIATQRGEHDDAVRYATELLDGTAAAGMGDSINYAVALNVRGVALMQRGDYELARRDVDRARQRYEVLVGPDTPTTGNAWYALGQLERLAGNPRLALAHLDRAVPMAEASGNPHFAGNVLRERCQVLRDLDDANATSACSRAREVRDSGP